MILATSFHATLWSSVYISLIWRYEGGAKQTPTLIHINVGVVFSRPVSRSEAPGYGGPSREGCRRDEKADRGHRSALLSGDQRSGRDCRRPPASRGPGEETLPAIVIPGMGDVDQDRRR